MKYILKSSVAEQLREKYKNGYIAEKSGLSMCYVSLIMNRRRDVQKRIAYAFTKSVGSDLEINDLFDMVR